MKTSWRRRKSMRFVALSMHDWEDGKVCVCRNCQTTQSENWWSGIHLPCLSTCDLHLVISVLFLFFIHWIHRRQHATDDAGMSKHYVLCLLSQLTHFKLYSFRFQFRREVFLESVNSATDDATGREHIPIINNSIRKKTLFLTSCLNLFLNSIAVYITAVCLAGIWRNNK